MVVRVRKVNSPLQVWESIALTDGDEDPRCAWILRGRVQDPSKKACAPAGQQLVGHAR